MNSDFEWGWHTRFEQLSLVARLGTAEFKAQALQGRTQMGYAMPDRRWVDGRFRSAFAMVTRPFGRFGIAARAEAFDTHHRGSLWDGEYDEHGWSAMLAGKRDWRHFTGLVELLHVWSDSPARESLSGGRGRAKPSSRPRCECTGNHGRTGCVYRYPLNTAQWCVTSCVRWRLPAQRRRLPRLP